MAVTLGGTPTGAIATFVASVSVSHTATGTNRAVWVGFATSDAVPQAVSGVTYAGVACTSAYSNLTSVTPNPYFRSHGFYLAGDGNIPTSAQNAVGTLPTENEDELNIVVISLQGVDSTTPVGTPATSVANTSTPSVTVGSVGADDMVVDCFYGGDGMTLASSGPDANQTLGVEQLNGSIYNGSSYQDGADGGVMSWTLNATPALGQTYGAVAFKPAGGGGGDPLMGQAML